MQQPVQVIFHGIATSSALDTAVRQHAAKLERFHRELLSCRATIGQAGRHRHRGNAFTIMLDIRVPGAEIAVSKHHEADAFAAVREAFDALRRQLEDHARRQRGDVKHKA